MRLVAVVLLSLWIALPAPCQPQPVEPFGWAIDIQQGYSTVSNITYSVADGYESKLDVYARRSTTGPVPTVINIHGGGWVGEIGNGKDREELATRVSPLSYVRKDIPPIFTIHGTSDQLVPYSHATRLHAALDKAGVPNRLVTIPNGKHGGFTRQEMLLIYTGIKEFLTQHKIL